MGTTSVLNFDESTRTTNSEKMVQYKIVFIAGILAAWAITMIDANNADLYCKHEAFNFHICRQCEKLTESCETTKDCQCGNIQLYDKEKGKLVGGSSCESSAGNRGNWCFVSSTSPCRDKLESRIAKPLRNLWHNNTIFGSYDACKPENRIEMAINQETIAGMRIVEDVLEGSDGYSTNSVALEIETGDHQGCQEECEAQCSKCGAWSFDETNGICYLHTVDACCGQLRKRKPDSNFISGYRCPQCSSSLNECPCSLKQRLKGDFGCSDSERGSGAKKPQFPIAGLLRVDKVNTNEDPCKCEYRKMRRGCRCVKQHCHDKDLNPDGTCEDRRRCRARPLNKSRFPLCQRQIG